MHNRYSDFAELRPTGEASHIPDTRLDDGCEGDPRRQRVATSSGGYPDAPTVTDGECRSCGASVPDSQMKCRVCLSNHLGSDATSTNGSASSTTRLFTISTKRRRWVLTHRAAPGSRRSRVNQYIEDHYTVHQAVQEWSVKTSPDVESNGRPWRQYRQ